MTISAWEKEKAYRAKRAAGLAVELKQAIADKDQATFANAYTAALRYMPAKERKEYMMQFLAAMKEV